ncbi:MAG: hypothetical protein RL653_993 [Pseudomonadota bacterium]|jgi:hypothetical protein
MTFAHPWMLLGALAALIPLLVHLFDRRRPRPVPFASLSFVLRSQKRSASRLKLRRLLVYLLRTTVLLALPLALARPEWKSESVAGALAQGPAATALVLDASLSLRFSDGKPLFEKARARARDALARLSPEEPATVVVCTREAGAPPPAGFDRARLRNLLDEAKPTYASVELNRCLEQALRALDDSPLPARRLVVVSDFTQGSLRLEASAPTWKDAAGVVQRPEFQLEDVARDVALSNRALVDLKVLPAVQVGPRAFQFTFTVRNFSDAAAKDVQATLKVGSQVVAKGFVDVPAHGTAQKTLTHRFEEGGSVVGEVALSPDGLAEDDVRPFTLEVPRELRALVVNGQPNPTRYRDEAFFVDAALTAQGSPARPALRDVDAAFREDLSAYDEIFLLNVPAPPEDVAAKLREFVEAGGGLFVSAGDQVDPDAWNVRMGPLLPRPLRVVRTAAGRDDPDADARAERFAQVDDRHPLLSPFTGEAREGLMSSRFFKYALLEAAGAGEAQVLAHFRDGAPALVAARRGKGRVLLFTSTVDRDWSDFSIRTSFLPLMHRTAAWLAGSLDEREALHGRVGETLALPAEASAKAASAESPSGETVPGQRLDSGALALGPFVEPGHHAVLDSGGKPLPGMVVPVTLEAGESDLSRLGEDALSAWFGEASVKAAAASAGPSPVPLWSWLLVVAAVAFFLEGLLLRK